MFELDDAKGLLRAGIEGFTHLVRDKEIDEEFLQLLKQHPGVFVTPNLGITSRGMDSGRPAWLDDPLLHETIPPAEIKRLENQFANRKPEALATTRASWDLQVRNLTKMREAGVRVVLGSDSAGDPSRTMGIHRNVIHPRFGNFILLGTVLMEAAVTEYQRPLDYNPCLECKLCVAACPVGAIGSDGAFNFAACFTHNYREFYGGFINWVEQIVESKSARDYRNRISNPESASMWQSLSFGANYKSAYCMAVCPAGEDVIAPFLTDRTAFLKDVVRPLQEKEETVYVVGKSDAEDYVSRRFPKKHTKRVGNSLNRLRSISAFLAGLRLTFQRGQSKGIAATYHFTFTGDEDRKATVIIRDGTVDVKEGHVGNADLQVMADSHSWLGFLAKERSLVWALIRRKIRLKGSPRLLLAFGKCFPS